MQAINNTNLNAVHMQNLNAAEATSTVHSGVSVLGAQKNGWSVTDEKGLGIAVAGEEPVSDEALRRDDDLGALIGKAYGI